MLVSTGTTTKGSWTASLAWANWLYQCTCTGIIFLWLFFCIKHFQIHEIITSVTPVNTTRFVNNCIYIYWVLQVFSSHFISFRLTTYWLIISLSCRTWLHYWEYRMQRLHGCTLHFQIDAVYIYIFKFKFYKNNKASMLSKFSFINRTTSTLKMFDWKRIYISTLFIFN